jgi:O-acetylhomoserine (thiol)-lyase
MTQPWSFETLQVHAGQQPDPTTGARALPLYQTTAYQFRDTEHAANLFGLAELGNIYTRIMNPTQDAVEQRLAALEGGVAALLVSSGSAATTFAILNVAEAGDHIVSSPSLYGGTYNLFHYTLPKFGVEVTFVEDPSDPESWRKAVRPNTKAFFGETIANPKNEILDIKSVADVAHEVGVPLIVDNTVATPYLIKPIEFGADVVVHSATKFLSGHGNAVVGAIIDSGKFDYAKYPERFTGFNLPDPSYHGLVFAQALGVGSVPTLPTSSKFACNSSATSERRYHHLMRGCSRKDLKLFHFELSATLKMQNRLLLGLRAIQVWRKSIMQLFQHLLGMLLPISTHRRVQEQFSPLSSRVVLRPARSL